MMAFTTPNLEYGIDWEETINTDPNNEVWYYGKEENVKEKPLKIKTVEQLNKECKEYDNKDTSKIR